MRRITPEKVDQVRGRGGRVLNEKGRPYIPRPERQVHNQPIVEPEQPQKIPVEPPKDDSFMRDITGAIVTILKNQDATTKQLQAAIHELSKPKPKKQWGCTVTRDLSGNIKTIDIEERP